MQEANSRHVLDYVNHPLVQGERRKYADDETKMAHHLKESQGEQLTTTCEACGTAHWYGAIFWECEKQRYVQVGWICAERFCGYSPPPRKRKEKEAAVQVAREKAERNKRIKEYLVEHAELFQRAQWHYHNHFVRDIFLKLAHYGKLSDKQLNALQRVVQDEEAKSRGKPVPEGRTTVKATLKSRKSYYTDYGVQTKALFVTDAGYKIWGNLASAFVDARDFTAIHDGDRFQFRAQLTPSDDDPYFGFFKRPTKVEFLGAAETAEAVA